MKTGHSRFICPFSPQWKQVMVRGCCPFLLSTSMGTPGGSDDDDAAGADDVAGLFTLLGVNLFRWNGLLGLVDW